MSRHPLHLFIYTYVFLFALCACLFFNGLWHCIRMLNWLLVEYFFLGLISWCRDIDVLVFLVTTGMDWWLFVWQFCKKMLLLSYTGFIFNSFIVMYKNSLDIDVCESFFPRILLFACLLIGVLNLKSFNVVLMIVECWLFFGFHFWFLLSLIWPL
jgi:hypothetical protein